MSSKPLTGLEKAAVLLRVLPPAIVERVLAHMDPAKAKILMSLVATAEDRPELKDTLSHVLGEAIEVLSRKKEATAGENRASPNGAAKVPSGPQARPAGGTNAPASAAPRVDLRIADEPAPDASAEEDPMNHLDPLGAIAEIPPALLAQALEAESARTISLLMQRVDVRIAASVYKRLSAGKRKEVSLRFTEPATVHDELLHHIARAVLKKCQILRMGSSNNSDQEEREKRMAGLLRGLDRAERTESLQALEESDPTLAERIKTMLFLFEDILSLENVSVQKLLSEIDMKTLASALFGASPEIQDRIRTNLSRRAQEALKEEVELTGKVAPAVVKQSRRVLEEAMQRLDQRGELLFMEQA